MTRRALRRSLVAGAVYDLLLAAFVLFFAAGFLRFLGHPDPSSPFHFRLAALPLLLLPALYLGAARARELQAFRLPVLWARGGGGSLVILGALIHRPDATWIYLAVGALDLGWGALHLILWREASAGEAPARAARPR